MLIRSAILASVFICCIASNCFSEESAKVPSVAECTKLATTTMNDFCTAVASRDSLGGPEWVKFHATTSKLLQADFPPAKLQGAFSIFMRRKINLGKIIGDLQPIFDPEPRINEKNWLVLAGRYPAIPRSVQFVFKYALEENAWKLSAIDVHLAESPDAPVPPEAELKSLVVTSLTEFGKAVNSSDWKAFYASVAKEFQKDFTPEKFQEIFKKFSDDKVDIPGMIAGLEPLYDAPACFNEKDWLYIAGSFASKPKSLHFTVKFTSEAKQWKLIGINVLMADKPNERMPSEADLKTLVNATISSFGSAVNSGEWKAFHAASSKPLQDELTPEKFHDAFKVFAEKKIDFVAMMKDLPPEFSIPPRYLEGQVLSLTGNYPSKPHPFKFELSFVKENGVWKLLGINVKVL